MIVTVLTPTYNRVSTLPKLFESLCAQTEQNFQWLVIDDGSTDSTELFFIIYQRLHLKLSITKKQMVENIRH